jgi:hypothetical protein
MKPGISKCSLCLACIFISPAPLREIGIPDFNLFVRRLAADRKYPFEYFIIPAYPLCPPLEC